MNQHSTLAMCLMLTMAEGALALPPRPLAPRPLNKLAQPGKPTPPRGLPPNAALMQPQGAVSPIPRSMIVKPCVSQFGLSRPPNAASATAFNRPDCANADHTALSRLGGANSSRPFEAPTVGAATRSWLDDKPPETKPTLSGLASKTAQPTDPKQP